MKRTAWTTPASLLLAMLASLALDACSKQAETGAVPPAGTTGAGTMGAAPVPGTGLNGGLGTGGGLTLSTTSSGSATAPLGNPAAVPGSANTTTNSSVGNRP
ncbi:hypothetical protein HHL11_23225 [Ramlibacter sp. G-1-2-2]|uniref:Collagen-like protein n=1 Tax=Ramlibacter agri TaxID=2728837 RepID=A0A848H882_9BURK|nr:hypothetical protein [Ramlibacter agri]NML46677.1 hypothetical protein [Ramlibacter agri]